MQADYRATINWGDNNTSPGSFVYDTVKNVWDVQGSHTYAEGGDFTLTVTINIGTQIVTASSTVTVADVPLTNVTGARLTGGSPCAGVNVGLIEDSLPWSYHTDVDSDTTVATGLGYTVTKIPCIVLATTNLSAYSMIILAGDQSSTVYSAVQSALPQIEAYVAAGGVWVANDATYRRPKLAGIITSLG